MMEMAARQPRRTQRRALPRGSGFVDLDLATLGVGANESHQAHDGSGPRATSITSPEPASTWTSP
jgi:hypothetical protein